jgi:hypothetical protein
MASRKPTVKNEDEKGLIYQPRRLSVLELDAKFIVVDDIGSYLQGRFKYDEAEQKYVLPNRVDKIAFNSLAWMLFGKNYTGKGLTILFADATGELPVAEVVRWAEEYPAFFEECYKKAIELNPSLAPASEGLTTPQPETRDKDGKPISKEEAEKNA